MTASIRTATLDDLAAITEIHNHYILNTHITFDVRPYQPEERVEWFHNHSDGKRYRLLVACHADDKVIGYACTGRHRNKEAYDTTVEASVALRPDSLGRGVGTMLYHALFSGIAQQDIHQVVAGIAQPNPASNALHERLGFKPIGTFNEIGRKFGKYWDVRWFARALLRD